MEEPTDMIEKLYALAESLNRRFPEGNEPFQIATRLAEECGEVASEVNHFEDSGVKIARRGPPDRGRLAKELQDVLRVVLQLALYYDLREELATSVDRAYKRHAEYQQPEA